MAALPIGNALYKLMTLTESGWKLRTLVVAVAALFLVIAIIVIFTLVNRKSKPSLSPQPLIAPNVIIPPQKKPEDLSSSVQEIRKKIIASQIANVGGDILLYKTAAFKIEYVPTPNIFFVTVNKDPATEAKASAQKWFLDFGLKQEDLCDLPVRFVLGNFEIRKTNPTFTSLPDGCTGEPLKKP